MTWLGAVFQKGSDLGFLFGRGRASKSLTSDLPRFLRRMKKAGPGVGHQKVHAVAGQATWRDLGLGRRVLTVVP